jgi:hypothetical protein
MTKKESTIMPIAKPKVDADDYLAEDSETAKPKVGTTVQSGWDSFDEMLSKTETNSDYPVDFKFTEEPVLVKFLENAPFKTYNQHWIDRPKGKRSFICLGDDCPLCDILGDKPRPKLAFNVVVLSGEAQGLQVLTAPPMLGRQLRKVHDDDRKGPLGREFWELSRSGTGPQTVYNLGFVRGRDLEEEWALDLDAVKDKIETAEAWTAEAIRETPYDELLEVARSVA